MDPSLQVALERLGPRGGLLDNQVSHPERRQADYNGHVTGMHRRFEKPEVAVTGLKNEQPWHRMAAFMLNAGRTNSEIAMAAEVTPQSVSNLRGQKWFQQLCATIANTNGEEIMGALRSYTLDAIEGIAEIAQGSSSDRVRLSAYQILLEQAHGKPVQKVLSHTSHTTLSPDQEKEEIERELLNLRNAQ